MNKYCAVFLLCSFFYVSSFAQTVDQTKLPAQVVLSQVSPNSPMEFEYNATPLFALHGLKASFWQKLNPAQADFLENLDYPKFVSNGLGSLEADILRFQNEIKAWNTANAFQASSLEQQFANLITDDYEAK